MELSLGEHHVHLLWPSNLIFKKHVEPSPLFLPHLQWLLHCTFRQDYLIPIRCLKAHGLCRSPERGGRDWAAQGSGSSSHSARLQQSPRYAFPEENPVWGSSCFVSDHHKGFDWMKWSMYLCLSAPSFYFDKFQDRLSLPEFDISIILLLLFICSLPPPHPHLC